MASTIPVVCERGGRGKCVWGGGKDCRAGQVWQQRMRRVGQLQKDMMKRKPHGQRNSLYIN
eukprot:1148208-Pelagomonas_calceolata.AAC.13